MKVVVYTALFGPAAPKTLSRPPLSTDTLYYCVTDRQETYEGWETIPSPFYLGDDRYMARTAKTSSSRWFLLADATIWMDASFTLTTDPQDIVAEAFALTGYPEIVGLAHPDRRSITQEAVAIINAGQAPRDAVERQLREYHDQGFDTDESPQIVLTTTGLLVRTNGANVVAFNRFWQEQIRTHTVRDQLSIDYCAWTMGMKIGHLPGSYRDNRYAKYDRTRRIPTVL